MIELDEYVQRLAESVEVPDTGPEDDLARGRSRRRHRNFGTLGAALATTAAIGIGVLLVSGSTDRPGAGPGLAGDPSAPAAADASAIAEAEAASRAADQLAEQAQAAQSRAEQLRRLGMTNTPQMNQILSGYRDILREDLDPGGTRIQTSPITNRQGADQTLGTKLDWKGGGMLQIAVGRSLEGVQFSCDNACTPGSVAGASKALVLASPGRISVAVFQEDGDVVALTADTSFGNNGTSTRSLGLSVDQLLAAAADPRLEAPPAG